MAQQIIDVGSAPGDDTGDIGRDGGIKINDNFTELYSYGPDSALQADGSVDGTGQLFTGHVGVGGDASIGTDAILTLQETIQDDGGLKNAQLFDTVFSGSPVAGSSITAFNGRVSYEATPTVPTGGATGLFFTAFQNSATAMSNLIGAAIAIVSSAASGAITNYLGIDVRSLIGGSSGAITNSTGVKINDFGASVVTNAIGLEVEKQANSTNNYGIMLNGDDLGADITFGAGQDVRMHYDGTNMTLEGSGITAVSSTATVNNTIPIDINGTVYHIMLSTTA